MPQSPSFQRMLWESQTTLKDFPSHLPYSSSVCCPTGSGRDGRPIPKAYCWVKSRSWERQVETETCISLVLFLRIGQRRWSAKRYGCRHPRKHTTICSKSLLEFLSLYFFLPFPEVEDEPDGHPPDGFVVVKRVVKEDPLESNIDIKVNERVVHGFDLDCCKKTGCPDQCQLDPRDVKT